MKNKILYANINVMMFTRDEFGNRIPKKLKTERDVKIELLSSDEAIVKKDGTPVFKIGNRWVRYMERD